MRVDIGELRKFAFLQDAPCSEEEAIKRFGLEQPLQGKGIEFKPPQLIAHYMGLASPRFILGFDKGMGKTVTYLSIAIKAQEAEPGRKIIILASKNAQWSQIRELQRYWPHKTFSLVRGTAIQRAKSWNLEADVYILTATTLLADMGMRAKSAKKRLAPAWVEDAFFCFDEFQRSLRSHRSSIYKMLKGMKLRNIIFASGSLAGRGPADVYAALSICEPTLFRGYWPYVNTYCEVVDGIFGKEILGPKNVEGWRNAVSPYLIRRVKDLKYYPPKTRQVLPVEMEKWQKDIHRSLVKELMAVLPDNTLFLSPNTAAAHIKLQEFMICPKTLHPDYGWGAGLEGILDDMEDTGHTHYVISTPFRKPIPFIQEFFAEKGYPTFALTGALKNMEEVAAIIQNWTNKGGIIIQTIDFAESYELPAARVMYMLGYKHQPDRNMQAEDRIHRDIRVTPYPVDIYYVKHIGAYDEKILEALAGHADNVAHLLDVPLKQLIQSDERETS